MSARTAKVAMDLAKSLKFSANISSLLLDVPDHIESYRVISNRTDYKFTAVEAQDPYKNDLDHWKAFLAGQSNHLDFILINSPNALEKYAKQLPTMTEFEDILKQTGDYVKALEVKKVHMILFDLHDASEMKTIKQFLVKAAQYLQDLNVTCLIEPLAPRANYYLRSYDQALELVKELKQPNLKIMFDSYHCQCLHGNLTHYLEKLQPYIGHVQLSQTPLRDCPLNDGEVNHEYLLRLIAKSYDGHIGLEYFNFADDSFEWLNQYSLN